jgi:hypothetical protein
MGAFDPNAFSDEAFDDEAWSFQAPDPIPDPPSSGGYRLRRFSRAT